MILAGQLKHMFIILKHPIDGFEGLRLENKGNILSASILLVFLYVVRVLSLTITGFIFSTGDKISLQTVLVQIFVPFFLWVAASYLVGSIAKGQARLKDVFIASAYSFAPYILLALPLAIVSRVLTKQEESIYNFLSISIVIWCCIIFYIQVKVVQAYEIMETFIVILCTLFLIFLIIVIALAMTGMLMQNINFIMQIFMEVKEIV